MALKISTVRPSAIAHERPRPYYGLTIRRIPADASTFNILAVVREQGGNGERDLRSFIAVIALTIVAAAFPSLSTPWPWSWQLVVYDIGVVSLGVLACVFVQGERTANDKQGLFDKIWPLANDLHDFVAERRQTRPSFFAMSAGYHFPTKEEVEASIVDHDEYTVALYRHRFAPRVREVAIGLRRHKAIPTDVFFKYSETLPMTLEDITNIAHGLERLGRQLVPKPMS
jgi:hypothetical protein